MLTHYDVLGVEPNADFEDIRHAWRMKVRLFHPDRHRGSPSDVQTEAALQTRRVNDAWETLRDPDLRRQYDQTISAARPSGPQIVDHLSVMCAICNTVQRVPRTVGRFDCINCRMAWQFAKCEACNEITHVRERKTSWECPLCGRQQSSSWGGAKRYVFCTRCKTGTLTSPYLGRFSCPRCKLVHVRCDCGQYTPVVGWQWRSWRCPKCRRVNPPARHVSFDMAQVVTVLVATFFGVVGIILVTGLAR